MKKVTLAVFAALTVFVFSCNNNGDKTNNNADSTKTSTTENNEVKAPAGSKYQIKSGIVSMNSEIMGIKNTVIMYFDDYGKKESKITTGEFMGIKTENMNLTKDGYMYTVDLLKKTGTKMKALQDNPQDLDFSALSEEIVKEMNIKKEGTETFLGKTCDKFSINYEKMRMKGSYLVWQNIAIKTDMQISGMKMKVEATKIEENISIPADKFEIPADIKIQDQNMEF